MNIVFVHGAWATKESFNYIAPDLKHNKYFFEYDCQKNNFLQICEKLKDFTKYMLDDERVVFVGHSLGGLISLYTAQTYFPDACNGVMTISSPVKGIYINPLIRPFMYLRSPILNEVSPDSNIIRSINKFEYEFPIVSVVSVSSFSPAHIGESDGVLPVTAQMWKPKTKETFEITKINNSHNEILLTKSLYDKVWDATRNFNTFEKKLEMLRKRNV